MKGIESPIVLELSDNRFIDRNDSIIAKGKCNLQKGKVKFDVNLQIGLSLKDKDLDRSIVFHYELLRRNFMKEENSPFTICYKVNYALSNNHHNIEFKGKDLIYINELFSLLVQVETQKFQKYENKELFVPSYRKNELEKTESNLQELNKRLIEIEHKL